MMATTALYTVAEAHAARHARNVPREVVAWAAGFFDGEGCVRIVRQGSDHLGLGVAVGQVDDTPLLELQAWWSGTVHLHPAHRANQRPLWQWRVHGRSAAVFLEEVRPHLRVKGPAADVGLRFATTLVTVGRGRSRPHLTSEEIAIREACLAEIREINRVGVPWMT